MSDNNCWRCERCAFGGASDRFLWEFSREGAEMISLWTDSDRSFKVGKCYALTFEELAPPTPTE